MAEVIKYDFLISVDGSTRLSPNIVIFYVLSGKLSLTVEEECYEMKESDFILVNANKKYSLKSLSSQILCARLELDYFKLTEYMGTSQILFWCNTVTDKDEAYTSFRKVMDQIFNLYFDETVEMKFHIRSMYHELLYLLVSNFTIRSSDKRIMKNTDDVRIIEIRNYLYTKYNKQLSLRDLAEQLHFSEAYLSRYIKENLGMSFIEYLNNIRLFHAVDEMLYTDKKILQIAIDNGYPNSTSFNKAFKKSYHMTPTEFRCKRKKDVVLSETEQGSMENKADRIKRYLETKGRNEARKRFLKEDMLQVDTEHSRKLSRPWEQVLNIGNAEGLTRSDIQEHIRLICESLHFEYARIWNVLASFLFAGENGERRVNFSRLDRVMDFLLELGLKPQITIGKYKDLCIRKADEVIYIRKSELLFDTVEEYLNIFDEFVQHILNRYGLEEVEKWRFDVWDDERTDIQAENSRYYLIFEGVYKKLKSIFPHMEVGGLGIVIGYENYLYDPIFSNWSRREIKPDYLSVHSYGYVTYQKDREYYSKKSLDSKYTLHQLELMKEKMELYHFNVEKIYVNEWGFSISNRNVLQDSCAMGAYVLKNYIVAENKIGALAYSMPTDLLSEYYDTTAVLNGDRGLLSKDGCRKPMFYAIEFLQSLQKKVLGKNENMIITTNEKNSFVILLHNNKRLTYKSILKPEDEIEINESGIYQDEEEIQLSFSIKNVKDGKYLIKTSYMNRSNGSVQDEWVRLGKTESLSQSEIAYLKAISVPHRKIETVNVEGGILEMKVNLEAHEIRMMKIEYQY